MGRKLFSDPKHAGIVALDAAGVADLQLQGASRNLIGPTQLKIQTGDGCARRTGLSINHVRVFTPSPAGVRRNQHHRRHLHHLQRSAMIVAQRNRELALLRAVGP